MDWHLGNIPKYTISEKLVMYGKNSITNIKENPVYPNDQLTEVFPL